MLALAVGFMLPAGGPAPGQDKTTPDVVYVGTPYDVVSAMLQMAQIKKEDVVYDLGCGDGRMIVLAAKKYGCRGFGFDIDPERISASLRNVKKNQVENLVQIVRADLFKLDFKDADVLSLYLLPEINEKLLPQFEKLKPGSRLVFHNYGLEGIKPNRTLHVISNEDNVGHTLYLFVTPLQRLWTKRGSEKIEREPGPARGAERAVSRRHAPLRPTIQEELWNQ
jgi:SAM-dependent methyltransferase